jgi:D-glycero-D-manno-heptose 1,7-bisphosphate phosphatase
VNPISELQKIVFLDRDGVINRDSPAYIKDWNEFEFLPGSLEALQRLAAADFVTIIISNQSAVNRGLMSLETLLDIHQRLKDAVAIGGGHIADVFFCPHRPDEGCDCRKPKPGLIMQACRSHKIEVKETVMIGDSAKDIECARKAGCAAAVLVKTGNGLKALEILERKGISIDFVAENLAAASDWILSR